MATLTVALPERVLERARREAERLGLSLDAYLVELLCQGLDPRDRAAEYVEAARELLRRARGELERGEARQAAEKVWGAAALAVKAYALWREGRRLASHRELWEYKSVVAGEVGGWVKESWFAASSMHTCFYEGWCDRGDVEAALRAVERLVEAVAERVAAHQGAPA